MDTKATKKALAVCGKKSRQANSGYSDGKLDKTFGAIKKDLRLRGYF